MTSKLHGLEQTHWRWLIAVYLFLAGAGGGAHIASVVAGYMGWTTLSKVGIYIGWPLVLIGSVCLLADLGQIKNAWRVIRKPDTSWISRGTMVISTFMILAFIHSCLLAFGGSGEGGAVNYHHTLGVLGGIFAFGTMVYTGLLLGDAIPIPFWSTILLPILFFMSALSTGVMAVVLFGTIAGAPAAQILTLAQVEILLIVMEMLILAAFMHGTYRIPNTRMSAEEVLAGTLAPMFWFPVVIGGLVLPLLIDILFHSTAAACIAAILGLNGGLFLRYIVLRGGAMYPMAASGFQFRPVQEPKMPMPDKGSVPPGLIS